MKLVGSQSAWAGIPSFEGCRRKLSWDRLEWRKERVKSKQGRQGQLEGRLNSREGNQKAQAEMAKLRKEMLLSRCWRAGGRHQVCRS